MKKRKRNNDKFLDTKAIEEKAVNYLKTFVEEGKCISQYLTDNDKEPCWDGHFYLYDGKGKSKEHLLGRVPVQVKGIEVERFQLKKWKFKLEKCDLKAYLNVPTFFIVCQIKKGSKERKLFYRELLPCTVKKLLRDMGDHDSRKTLFHPLTDSLEEFENQLLLFMRNSQKMISFADSLPLTISDAMKKGVKSFSFVAPPIKSSDQMRLMRYLSTHYTYLYANISKELNVTIPISDGPMKFAFQKQEKCEVKAGGRVFYDKFTNEIKDGKMQIGVGGVLTMTIPLDENERMKASVNITTVGKYLDDCIHEMEFVLALNDSNTLTIGTLDLQLYVNEKDVIAEIGKSLDNLKALREVLDKLHVDKPFDLSAVTPEQEPWIDVLIDTVGKGKRVRLPGRNSSLLLLEIGNVTLLLWCVTDKQEVCAIGDFFDGTVGISYLYKGKERIQVSPYTYLQNDALWTKVDNVDYDGLLPSAIKAVGNNKHSLELLNYDVLAMLSAADALETSDPEKRSKLLEGCGRLNGWLQENEVTDERRMAHKCNQMQIIKRQRCFRENETSEMKMMLESDGIPCIYKAAIGLLLEDKKCFEAHYNQLSDTERQALRRYPIWRYAKIIQNDNHPK